MPRRATAKAPTSAKAETAPARKTRETASLVCPASTDEELSLMRLLIDDDTKHLSIVELFDQGSVYCDHLNFIS